MVATTPARRGERAPERPFGGVDLLTLVLQASRPTLGFDIAVAVLCEDGRHVVPVFAAGELSAAALEGVHVQALAAFVELAGADHASWPDEDPTVVRLDGTRRDLPEPDDYEDAPLVVAGAVMGMLRIAAGRRLSQEQRARYFAMASDLSKALERLDAQRRQTRHAQERLLQSEKMSSVGQLVSGVAHELNNPLTGIMGFAQLLLLKDLDAGTRKQIETMYAEAERASKIVSNLLSFARRRKPQKELASLNTLVERVLELRHYDLRVRNIDVDLALAANLPETLVDPDQLLQVFLNIVLNAEQAMRRVDDSEGAAGMLRIVTETGPGGTVVASFADSGPGMNAETMRRVFDPFFTTKDAGEGTGLGLTISYNIVEEHGGRIWAESQPGRGTTFHLELPVVSAVPARASRETTVPPELAKGIDHRRILVVDDEESIQQILIGVLEMDGHDVAVAHNGRDALDRVQREPFDLIISDIKMPVMSGPDLFRRLSDAANPLARRMIFITGDTVSPDTRRFLQGIENAVLSKPFRLRDVRESVRAALAR